MKSSTFMLFLFAASQVFFIKSANCQDTNFVRINTWHFENFSDSLPSWDVFRETYIGVAPTYASASIFDQILYDNVHAKMINTGHCFGMNIGALQLIRYGGYSGFCAPASQYPRKYSANEYKEPADSRLQRAIQILQGHILNYRVITYMLDLIAANNSRNGNFAYDQYKYFSAKKEYCTIGITESFTNVGASHALLPYHFTEDGAGNRKIYVYDVNRPFNKPGPGDEGHDWYIDKNNFIEIKSDGTWSFDMADNCTCPWSGSPSSDPAAATGSGHIFLMPFSIVGRKDRLPQSIFADAAEAIGKIFVLSQGTEIEQLSSPDGRHYFQPGKKTLELGDSVAMRSVLSFISNNSRPFIGEDAAQLYFIRGENDLNVSVKAGATGYKIQLFSDYRSITVESKESGIVEEIQVRDWHTPNPVVKVMCNNDKSNSVVEIQALHDFTVGSLK
ncbi:MAG: hypothetical protein JNN28_20130 [Saprospiraceae bacterium]|nr:hypothetical protein [Saprospiraceae bacterium]